MEGQTHVPYGCQFGLALISWVQAKRYLFFCEVNTSRGASELYFKNVQEIAKILYKEDNACDFFCFLLRKWSYIRYKDMMFTGVKPYNFERKAY